MNKKGVIQDYLTWVIIAVFVLGLMIIGIIALKEQGISWIDKLLGVSRA